MRDKHLEDVWDFYSPYEPLYPELAEYWREPLSKMPLELQRRVTQVLPEWDEIGCSASGNYFELKRQHIIYNHDWINDHSQDAVTYYQLKVYLETLRTMIDEAKKQDKASVAVLLLDEVVLPLEEMLSGGWARDYPKESLLWADLYWFMKKTLADIRNKAKADKDFDVALALQEVSGHIENILQAEEDWATRKGYQSICEDHIFDPKAAELKAPNEAGSLTNPAPTNNWILKIQTEATRRWKELVKNGCSPTKNSIKDDLARWCRENNVKTNNGIYPTGEYIYRHVLRREKWHSPD